MENTEKKTYIAPTIKCHEFKVEAGFAMSQSIESAGNYDERPTGVNWNPFNVHMGSYGNNNDDWD